MGAIWALGLAGALSASSGAAAASAWAVTLPWHVKVRPPAAVSGASSATLSAARGECEGFQVLAIPPAEEVDVRIPKLAGPGAPLALRLYREEYVEVKIPSDPQGATGSWPDPLIPVVDAYASERRRALPAGSSVDRPLVLYVEVCVPAAQAPGSYHGELVLQAKARPEARIPVALEVQPFTLPPSSSLPNSFGLSLYTLAHGHGLKPESLEARELLRAYATSMLAHRLSAHGMGMDPPPARSEGGRLSVDFSGYDREMGPFLSGEVLPSGARFTTTDIRHAPKALSEDDHAGYYRAFREHLVERGWKAQPFFYTRDEPPPADYPLVLNQSRRVRKAGGIPVLITAPLDPVLTPAADIICPPLNCFFERPGPPTCRAVVPTAKLRKKVPAGTRVWWYQGCLVHGCTGPSKDPNVAKVFRGWASYMVDHPAFLNRAMGPLAFLEGIDGELYYDTAIAYWQQKDVWQDTYAFGGNGDGTLYYPGTPQRVGGTRHVPIESLRLKHIRDGLEDYEYLRLAAERDAPLARRSVEKLARSGYEISQDPAVWEQVRADLTAALAAHPKQGGLPSRPPGH